MSWKKLSWDYQSDHDGLSAILDWFVNSLSAEKRIVEVSLRSGVGSGRFLVRSGSVQLRIKGKLFEMTNVIVVNNVIKACHLGMRY